MNVTSPVGCVPVTDPTPTATPATLVLTRVRYFEAPNVSTTAAAGLDLEARTPIGISVTG